MKKIFLFILSAVLLTSCIPVKTINHRGYSDYAPENTMKSLNKYIKGVTSNSHKR